MYSVIEFHLIVGLIFALKERFWFPQDESRGRRYTSKSPAHEGNPFLFSADLGVNSPHSESTSGQYLSEEYGPTDKEIIPQVMEALPKLKADVVSEPIQAGAKQFLLVKYSEKAAGPDANLNGEQLAAPPGLGNELFPYRMEYVEGHDLLLPDDARAVMDV